MKLNCNVIQDLLPLYVDQVCSEESKELIDEHLMECKECSKLLYQMGSSEIETDLKSEAEDVIQHQAKFFKRKYAVIGVIMAVFFMCPLLISIIINLLQGPEGLEWTFIGFGILLMAVTLFAIPFILPKSKTFWSVVIFIGCLFLLMGIIWLYTGGVWFDLTWIIIVCSFVICFFPFALLAKPVRALLERENGLTTMLILTMLYVVMVMGISFGIFSGLPEYSYPTIEISIPCLVLAWMFFILIRYPKCNGLIKGGLCVAMFGLFSSFIDHAITIWQVYTNDYWWDDEWSLPILRPFTWNLDTINDNIMWLLLIIGVSVGLIMIVAGIIKGKIRK